MFTIISQQEDEKGDFNNILLGICMGTLDAKSTEAFLKETELTILPKQECDRVKGLLFNGIKELTDTNILSKGLNNMNILQYKNGMYITYVKTNDLVIFMKFIISKNGKISVDYYRNTYDTKTTRQNAEVFLNTITDKCKEEIIDTSSPDKTDMEIFKNLKSIDATSCESDKYNEAVKYFITPELRELTSDKYVKTHKKTTISPEKTMYITIFTYNNKSINLLFILSNNQLTYKIQRYPEMWIVGIISSNNRNFTSDLQITSTMNKLNEEYKFFPVYFWNLIEEFNVNSLYKFNHNHNIKRYEKPRTPVLKKIDRERLIELSKTGELQERDIITE